MPEIAEYVLEKLEWAAERIREFLVGSKGYRVREVKERIPKVTYDRMIYPNSRPDDPCGKY